MSRSTADILASTDRDGRARSSNRLTADYAPLYFDHVTTTCKSRSSNTPLESIYQLIFKALRNEDTTTPPLSRRGMPSIRVKLSPRRRRYKAIVNSHYRDFSDFNRIESWLNGDRIKWWLDRLRTLHLRLEQLDTTVSALSRRGMPSVLIKLSPRRRRFEKMVNSRCHDFNHD